MNCGNIVLASINEFVGGGSIQSFFLISVFAMSRFGWPITMSF